MTKKTIIVDEYHLGASAQAYRERVHQMRDAVTDDANVGHSLVFGPTRSGKSTFTHLLLEHGRKAIAASNPVTKPASNSLTKRSEPYYRRFDKRR